MEDLRIALGQLAEPAERAVEPVAFARDNYFNLHNTPGHLQATSPLSEVLAHIVGIEGVPLTEALRQHLANTQEIYQVRQQGQAEAPFPGNSRLEQLLGAFDEFMFDKHQTTYLAQVEAVLDFGRFTVRNAIIEPLGKVS